MHVHKLTILSFLWVLFTFFKKTLQHANINVDKIIANLYNRFVSFVLTKQPRNT